MEPSRSVNKHLPSQARRSGERRATVEGFAGTGLENNVHVLNRLRLSSHR
jgi:hypothetical protein